MKEKKIKMAVSLPKSLVDRLVNRIGKLYCSKSHFVYHALVAQLDIEDAAEEKAKIEEEKNKDA